MLRVGETEGKRAALVEVGIIVGGQSGQCELALRQDRAKSESITLAAAMHAEGRPRLAALRGL